LLEDTLDLEVGRESKENEIQIPKSKTVSKILEAGRNHRAKTRALGPGIIAEPWFLPHFRGHVEDPYVDF